jgi:hypothetical protein
MVRTNSSRFIIDSILKEGKLRPADLHSLIKKFRGEGGRHLFRRQLGDIHPLAMNPPGWAMGLQRHYSTREMLPLSFFAQA